MMSTATAWNTHRRRAWLRGAISLLGLALTPACAADRSAPEPIAVSTAKATWIAEKKIVAANEHPYDRFGTRIAMAGDTIVAGAPNTGNEDNPATYVFVRSGESWTQQIKLPPPIEAKYGIGGFLAISGNTIVVGATADDDGGPSSGSAYVFARSGTTWSQQARLLAGIPVASARFGVSVAIAENIAVVGSLHDGAPATADTGAAYVFERSGEIWSPPTQLLADDGMKGDQFGSAVAVAGNTIVVGAQDHGALGPESGAAYVFVWSGASWNQQQKLLAEDGSEGDGFGRSLAIEGDTIVVGAYHDDVDSQTVSAGSAYVFARSGGIWTQQQKLLAGNPAAADYFGESVALSGDKIVVGARSEGPHPGSAYVFARSGEIWSQQQKLFVAGATEGNIFGYSVAVAGNTVIVGAGHETVNGPQSGAVHPFVLRFDNGDACAEAGQCLSGFCVDGLCCYSACDQADQACSAAKKGWGVDGVCGPIDDATTTSTGGSTGSSTSGGGASASAASAGGFTASATGAGGALGDEQSYYSCEAIPGRGAGSDAASLVAATLALAAGSRKRRSAARARRSAPAR